MRVLPWSQPFLDQSEIASVKAVRDGTASAEQQKIAWRVIQQKVCVADGISFTEVEGIDGRRATDFAEGKRFCANTLRIIADTRFKIDTHGAPPPIPPEQDVRRDRSAPVLDPDQS